MMRMAAARLFMVLLAVVAAPAMACINTFASEIDTAKFSADEAGVARIVADLEKQNAAKPTLENTNDLGVARILTGNYDAAIKLFREAEKKYPGSARVASNLGTALELKGENQEALEWIRESVKRDANEHEGSEWLHARILEVKIALAQNPRWFDHNQVLGLDFGKDVVPVAPEILPVDSDGKLKGVVDLIADIDYQLRERTKFIKPPDPIVGDLYATAGDLEYAGSDTDPTDHYEAALNYGAPRSDLIRKRMERFRKDYPAQADNKIEVIEGESRQPVHRPAGNRPASPQGAGAIVKWVGIATLAMLVLFGAGWLLDRRQRKRAEERARSLPPLPDVD
jgi:tetratricopeptide (TPR) repeat protein